MPDRTLRDANNRLLGRVRELHDGRRELRDANNRLLGHYDPRTDTTRDANNRLVGRGDLLTTLLR